LITRIQPTRVRLGLEFAGNWQRGIARFGKFLVVGIVQAGQVQSIFVWVGGFLRSILVIKSVVDGIAHSG